MFSKKSCEILKRMRISPDCYFKKLENKFKSEAMLFCKVIEHFDSIDKMGSPDTFMDFWRICKTGYDLESEIFNWAYEFYNNLNHYFNGGVFELFKFKQAEWGSPIVKITRDDVPIASDVELLDNPQKIYRGLASIEHMNKEYAPSWTLSLSEAERFARLTSEVYPDKSQGIVVETMVQGEYIVFYSKDNSEQEVIVEFGVIKSAEIVNL